MCNAAVFGTVQARREQHGERVKRLQPTRFSERLMQHAKVMPPLEVGNFQERRLLPYQVLAADLHPQLHPGEKAEVKRLSQAK